MLVDSTTIALTYTDATPALTAAVIAQMSITSDASGIKLSGDATSPGNNQVYGTNGSGVKGWKADPSGGLSDGDKGDVTVASSGTVWTIDAGVVTDAKLATVGTATFKGRTTAGTGEPENLTVTQATALLNTVVGDSGSGGTKGLVPAPAAGDAAASKFLKADGLWTVPSGSSGQTSIQFKDEGTNLSTAGTVDTVDFVGSGVTASRVGNVVTVTIASAGAAALGFTQIIGVDTMGIFNGISTTWTLLNYV